MSRPTSVEYRQWPFATWGPVMEWDHSALIPADWITFAHFAVSSAMSLPKSADEPGSTVAPRSATRVLNRNVIFEGNGAGALFFANTTSTVDIALRDCALANTVEEGLQAQTASVMVQNSTFTGSGIGVHAADGATMRISKTIITGNQDAI